MHTPEYTYIETEKVLKNFSNIWEIVYIIAENIFKNNKTIFRNRYLFSFIIQDKWKASHENFGPLKIKGLDK